MIFFLKKEVLSPPYTTAMKYKSLYKASVRKYVDNSQLEYLKESYRI